MQPQGTSLTLPSAYGSPSTVLRWEVVEGLLATAPVYWLATTRTDGRPHAVPVDGIWVDGAAFVGGHPATVHVRNLRADPRVVLHTESGTSPVIVEGHAEWYVPDAARATRLADAANSNYPDGVTPDAYRNGLWRIRPRVVLAWSVLHEDATRFSFEPGHA